jgi:ribosomal protein L37AE/L43A
VRKGDQVFHSGNPDLGLGEVLEVSADGAWVRFRDPVSGATETGLYPIVKLRIAEQAVSVPRPSGPLILRTKQSRRDLTGDIKQCAECHECRSGLWKFTRTSWGEVHLCDHCKTDAMNRTYGPVDVLPSALPGGLCGGKR